MANIYSGTLVYANIIEPKPKFESTEMEYSVGIVVDKTTAKAHNKTFPKQKAKEVEYSEFKNKFKIDPPIEEDEIYVITLKKPAQYKDGSPAPAPQVFLNKEGKASPIPKGVLVANGSVARVSFTVSENSYGNFCRLKAILIDELIEYKKAEDNILSEFGVEFEGAEDFTEETRKPAQKPAPKLSKPVDDDFDSETCPF